MQNSASRMGMTQKVAERVKNTFQRLSESDLVGELADFGRDAVLSVKTQANNLGKYAMPAKVAARVLHDHTKRALPLAQAAYTGFAKSVLGGRMIVASGHRGSGGLLNHQHLLNYALD